MIQLLLISACVSLVTIAILFIQRMRPRRINIPSFFLGQRDEQRFSNIKTTPPQWWEWLLVLLATVGAALAYFSQSQPQEQQRNQGEGLVWFDPTFSHIAALQRSPEILESIQESLRQLRKTEYIFIELDFESIVAEKTSALYKFTRVSSSALQQHLEKVSRQPTALSQPLDTALLVESLKRDLKLEAAQVPLTLITDAQSDTLRPMASLAESFEAVDIIRTPLTPQQLQGKRVPIVPDELAQLWQPADTESNTSAGGLPGTPNLLRIENAMARHIPAQARPVLSLEEFPPDAEQKRAQATPFSLFVAEEPTPGGAQAQRLPQPLLTTCTLDVAGPSELDGLSDLRAYATFFQIPLRPLACRSTESATSARAAEASDPWKYRRASVWVIPMNDFITGALFEQGRHWIPEGFAPETDALVYIADTRLQGFDSGLESVTLQLEANQPTVRMPLLPLPPSPLNFPWEMDGAVPRVKPRSISTNLKRSTNDAASETLESAEPQASYKILLRAADGTPLAYQLATRPPTVYLRTGGAAPNGELGRWGKWAGLWNNIKEQMGQRSPLLTRVQLNTPSEWVNWIDSQRRNNTPPLRYQVDNITLKGALIENRKTPLQPLPALYIRERDDQIVVVEPPPLERQGETLSQQDLNKLFPRGQGKIKNSNSTQTQAAAWQFSGMFLALGSLALLWLLQYRQRNKRGQTTPMPQAIGVLTLITLSFAQRAEAQNNRVPFDTRVQRGQDGRPETSTFPFRIAWCDATVPEPVQQRYSQLQRLLANRGTIDLPKEMLAGACRVGAAEIWWTSSLEALQAARVTQHIRSGGVVIAEGISLRQTPEWMMASTDPSIGLVWESPKRRGLLYRSFYLLPTFDGCSPERTLVLTLRKKINAQAPMGIVTPARFLTNTSEGADCFITDDEYRTRSFVNMMYALLTTDYKEDQMQLPEILNRIRSLGLEP
ncbi:MAG: hypothetical protein FJY29_04135 [Betaproteobacteria bacterium]|nr:hypothetical protein [Betaproteobacteria bacterium]